MFRKDEIDKLLLALGDRTLSDAQTLIKYLDARRTWDDSIYEVSLDEGASLEEKEGKYFEVKSYNKSIFTPFLDKRIENLKNQKTKEAVIITGDGDHWSNKPENQKSIEIYRNAVQSGCNITVMLRDLGAWTIDGSAQVLNEIGVNVGRAVAGELHGGVIGGEEGEMYAIHRYPTEGAKKILGESQSKGVNYTLLDTNFPPFVKTASQHLQSFQKNLKPYEKVRNEETYAIKSREELIKMENSDE